MLRLVKVAEGHRRFSLTAATAFVSAWVLCFATGVQAVQGAPVASTSAASLTVDEVQLVRADLADLREFSDEIDADPYAERAAADPRALVSGLAGKDVLLVFVESYGRVARAGHVVLRGDHAGARPRAPQQPARRRGTSRGAPSSPRRRSAPAAGWRTPRLQSGLWVDSERRYRQLLGADRMTLTSLFGRAGWRTVFDVPANTKDWPEGKDFYDFDQHYDSRNVGYAGPSSATPRCRTSTPSRTSAAASSRRPTGRR